MKSTSMYSCSCRRIRTGFSSRSCISASVILMFSLLAMTIIVLLCCPATSTIIISTSSTRTSKRSTTNKVIAANRQRQRQQQTAQQQEQEQSIFFSSKADNNIMSSNNQASSHYKSSVGALRQSSSSSSSSAMTFGSYSGAKLTAGQVLVPGFILCFPMNDDNPVYKFGVDSSGQLSYYINDALFWYATPPTSQTSACLFGGSCAPPAMEYIRLNAAGSLGGFDIDKIKIWDSHSDGGTYTESALADLGLSSEGTGGDGTSGSNTVVLDERRYNSTLEVTEEGVFIQDADGVKTWMVSAPPKEEAAPSSSSSSSSSPSSTNETEISVSGVVFLDSDGDGLVDSNSSSATSFGSAAVELGGMAVDLYDCAESENPVWLLMERTNSSGYYEFDSMDLMTRLEERGTSLIRVVITLPDSLSDYAFSPTSRDSDFDPNGQTNCLDLDADGKQSIVWNAGITNAAAIVSTTTVKPSRRPTRRPTAKPSSKSYGVVEDAANASTPSPTPSTSISSTTTSLINNSSVIISGLVFHDVNNNGYFDFHEETTLSDVQVELSNCDGDIISNGSTDANGMYGFSELVPGLFVVRFFPPNGYELGDIWTGLVDGEGNLIAIDANNHANPTTGSTECRDYQAGSAEYSINAGMTTKGASSMPSAKPSEDPNGDGTLCSGAKCPIDGMCRNKSGLCGAGVSFCNPESVWDPTCSEVSSASTVSNETGGAICNDDGSVGLTSNSTSNEGKSNGTVLSFSYALQGADGTSPDANLIAKFEKELNSRLACTYFDAPCLACDKNNGRRIWKLRRRMSFRARKLDSVEDSSMSGISPLPKDEPNPEKSCSGSIQSDCIIIDGKFTVYFPDDTSPETITEESDKIFSAAKREMEKNNWDGMQVSYDNGIAPTVASAENSTTEDSGGGLSSGGIAGIILFVLVLVAVVGVLLIRYIRNKSEGDDKEPLKQQQEVPFRNGDLESIQPRENDPYESDSDSSSSSSSSRSSGSSDNSTSSEEGEEEDDVRSSSVISGDSFPSNVAQATPSVLEVDYSSGEEDERSTNSTESEISSDIKKTTISSRGDDDAHENNQQSVPGVYNVEHNHDPDNFDNQKVDNDDDEEKSINSADPPGTSYRDLPQDYDWDSAMMAGAPPPRAHTRAMHKNQGALTDEYFDESSQRIDVFESESQSSGQSGSSRHLFAPRIGHGLDGLFLSNRTDQSQGSHGSQGSLGSQGRPFATSQGETNQRNVQYDDREHNIIDNQDYGNYNQDFVQEAQGLRGFYPIRSDGSSHSRYSGSSQGESGPYMDNDQNLNNQDNEYDSQVYNMDGNRVYVSNDYGNIDGYNRNQYNPPMFNMESGNYQSREHNNDSIPPMEENRILPPMNTRAYYDERVSIGDGFDTEEYHYRQSPTTAVSRPEELDEISQTDTASTHQMSNSSSRVPAVDNAGLNRELHEESVESISSIFKSLSDIQTRLATKEKEGILSEQGAMPRRKMRKDSENAYATLSYQQPPKNTGARRYP